MKKWLRGLLYILPGVLFLSYYPVIHFGADDTMNFELSLPIIWLVVFDVLALIEIIRLKKYRGMKGVWRYLLFPGFVTLSLGWTTNLLRGIFTVGLMWLIAAAILAMVILRKEIFEDGKKETFWKWFIGASLAVCLWCIIQCILDTVGVGRDYSLLCRGCTYKSFGFPHPNGFAIEPQFMGNLLLAPTISCAVLLVERANILKAPFRSKFLCPKCLIVWFFVFLVTLFLTFSRGAIYAFVVAMIFASAFMISKSKKKVRKAVMKLVGIVWGLVVLAFVFALNLQGIMTEIGPTKDSYGDGVAKVINQLSLGVVNIKQGKSQIEEMNTSNTSPVENPVEKSGEKEESDFDGYVPESTDTRVKLTGVALELWSQSPQNILVGVGIGGAGRSLYEAGLIESPKEIVQNEYASLLLEIGIVGIFILVLLAVMVIKKIRVLTHFGRAMSPQTSMVLALSVAYLVSLCFFSGLANGMHIYLLPVVLFLV